MPNPIHVAAPVDSLEPNSIRVDICEIEMTTINEDTFAEGQDDAEKLLPAGAARSDRAQVANGEAVDGSQRLRAGAQLESKSQVGCCSWQLCQGRNKPDFNDCLPLCNWLWSFGLLGFSTTHDGTTKQETCWFQALDLSYCLLFTCPALAGDLLITVLSVAFGILKNVAALRHSNGRDRLCNTIIDNCWMTCIAIISLIIMLSLALPSVTPTGHTGATVIEGSCNSRTRCHTSASCSAVSPSSYTCSCPSWLVGSGFDDDPCICRSAVFSTPDFGRSICVTPESHFTMAGLFAFIFGMSIFLIFALLGAMIGQIQVFLIWLLLVLFASSGRLNPTIQQLCGASSFEAQVCPKDQYCVDGVCSRCAFPDRYSWDDASKTCVDGVAGNCTAHSCASLPSSICVQKQNQFSLYHVCIKSSSGSSTTAVPGVTSFLFTVFMVTMT